MLARMNDALAARRAETAEMTKIMQTAAGVGMFWALTTMDALARGGRGGHGGGHGGHGGHGGGGHGGGHHGGAPGAPEIDVSQGLAALAIMLVAFLILREFYLRERTAN
jgi:hypothetical protein